MKKVLIFVLLLILADLRASEASQIIELEHTYSEIEGSSWGTDDAFREAIRFDEMKLPSLFRQILKRPKPTTVRIVNPGSHSGVFIDNTMWLYRELNICVDQRLKIESSGFRKAAELLKLRIVGIEGTQESSLIHFNFIKMQLNGRDPDFSQRSRIGNCDLLVFQAELDQFPFAQFEGAANEFKPRLESRPWLSPISTRPSQIPQMVLGLYYRHSENSIPVITFNPHIDLSFEDSESVYLTKNSQGRYRVDGRALFFHELGHVLGFAHIRIPSPMTLSPEMSVMGVENSNRNQEQIEKRFGAPTELWRRWDPQQTSIYRSLLWKWLRGEVGTEFEIQGTDPWISAYLCAMPGEKLEFQFRVFSYLQDSTVYGLIQDLPNRIELENPQRSYGMAGGRLTSDRFSIFQGMDLVLEYLNSPTEAFDFFRPEALVNSIYKMDRHLESEIYSTHFQIATMLGSIAPEAHGKYQLRGHFNFTPFFPGTYLPIMNIEVTEDPATCYH